MLMAKSRLETAVWAVRLLLFSAGIVSIVLVFKAAVIPFSFDIFFSTLPTLFVSLRSWLSPPYIYIVLNFIIISIAASSTFHHRKMHTYKDDDDVDDDSRTTPSQPPPSSEQNNQTDLHGPRTTSTTAPISKDKESPHHIHHQTTLSFESPMNKPAPSIGIEMVSPLSESGVKLHSDVQSASPRLAESNKANDNEEEVDTLEAMWKAITEGGGKSRTGQLKKSETWNAPPRAVVVESINDSVSGNSKSVVAAKRELTKSETFNDAVSVRRRGGLRRDTPMSHDELNRRVEAFISNFNHDMRLQRQESDQRFMEMINRGI